MSGTGPVGRFGGARFGDSMRFERQSEEDLRREQAFSGSLKATTSTGAYDARVYQKGVREAETLMSQKAQDKGTWYEHHDVPVKYRKLDVEGLEFAPNVVERVLDAIDPEKTLRRTEAYSPDLVAWLTLPVQMETRVRMRNRGNLDLIDPATVEQWDTGFAAAIAKMKEMSPWPTTQGYLMKLRDVVLNRTDDPTDGAKSSGGKGETLKSSGPVDPNSVSFMTSLRESFWRGVMPQTGALQLVPVRSNFITFIK